MILEDIPIFCFKSSVPGHFWWDETSVGGKTALESHRVYFTEQFLRHIVLEGEVGEGLNFGFGTWEMDMISRESSYWVVKHLTGKVWKLDRANSVPGYILGVWPD